MSIVVVGASHRSAPLWFLEALALDAPGVAKVSDALVAGVHVSEAVVLSTCNRTELYLAAETFHGAFGEARDVLADLTFLGPEVFSDHLGVVYDDDAVGHLFRVAAGLESLVVGEHEILGQVRSSWLTAAERGTAGPTLGLAFRHALEAGKRARTETAISRQTSSVPHAAVELAERHAGGSIVGLRAVVVGAGEMGAAAAVALRDRGAVVTVCNRSIRRAESLALELSIGATDLAKLPEHLATADVVMTATSAPQPWIGADDVSAAVAARSTPLVLVDIAVPRDIDPIVRGIDGVAIADMDDLRAFVDAATESRHAEVPAVEEIVVAEVERYFAASGSREVAPLVAALHGYVGDVRDGELDRFRARVDQLDPSARATLDAVVAGILGKLLHDPTNALKESAGSPRGARLAAALRELFDL